MLRDVEVRGGHGGVHPSNRAAVSSRLGYPRAPALATRRPGDPSIVPAPAALPATPGRGVRRRAARARPDRRADPRPPAAQRHRGERPPRRHRRDRRGRPGHPPARRPGSGRHPALDGQAVRAAGAHRGGRDRRLRSRAGRDRDHGQLALGRGPPRPDAPGPLSPVGRQPGAPRLRVRGRPARRADRGPPGPRRREGRSGPPHVLRASTRSSSCCRGCAAGTRPTTGSRATPRRSPIAPRSPGPTARRRRSCRPRSTAAASRPTRSPCARSPAPTRCWPTRRRSRPSDPRSELAASLTIDPRRDAGQPGDDRRAPRPDRHVADEGRARPARQQGRDGGAARRSRSCPGRGAARATAGASGMAIKIEDGDGYDRGTWAATVEALRQAGVARRRRAARPGALPPAGGPRPARTGRRRDDRRVRARAGGRAHRLSDAGRPPDRRRRATATDR